MREGLLQEGRKEGRKEGRGACTTATTTSERATDHWCAGCRNGEPESKSSHHCRAVGAMSWIPCARALTASSHTLPNDSAAVLQQPNQHSKQATDKTAKKATATRDVNTSTGTQACVRAPLSSHRQHSAPIPSNPIPFKPVRWLDETGQTQRRPSGADAEGDSTNKLLAFVLRTSGATG